PHRDFHAFPTRRSSDLSVICAKAKELLANGIVGTLTLVEGSLGRNDPTGAWVYPPPPDLSLTNFDWDTWQGDATKRAWDPDMSPDRKSTRLNSSHVKIS